MYVESPPHARADDLLFGGNGRFLQRGSHGASLAVLQHLTAALTPLTARNPQSEHPECSRFVSPTAAATAIVAVDPRLATRAQLAWYVVAGRHCVVSNRVIPFGGSCPTAVAPTVQGCAEEWNFRMEPHGHGAGLLF